MARHCGDIPFNVQLTVDAWKGVVAVAAPADQDVELLKYEIHLTGIAGDAEPIQKRFSRITKGTGTATSATIHPTNNTNATAFRATAKTNFTVAATATTPAGYLSSGAIHPQGGVIEDVRFDDIVIGEDTELLLELYVPATGDAVYANGYIRIRE